MIRSVFVHMNTDPNSWCGVAGIEQTGADDLWVTYYEGGPKEPHPDNRVALVRSRDRGATWSEPVVVADPPGSVAAWDPGLWRDPVGGLWLFYNTADHDFGKVACTRVGARIDTKTGAVGEAKPLVPGVDCFGLNRPTLLPNGDWAMPMVVFEHQGKPDKVWYYRRQQGIGVALSSDGGQHWRMSEIVTSPDKFINENILYVCADGRLRMLARTRTGRIWQTWSSDNGRTWSQPESTDIPNPNSRFFAGKLKNGDVVLFNNPSDVPDIGHHARTSIVLNVSHDDGKTWSPDHVIAAGQWIAYPDMVEDPRGGLHVIYDTGRQNILYCFLSPEDIGGR